MRVARFRRITLPGVAAVAISIGTLTTPLRAQPQAASPPRPAFEVASIKKSPPPDSGGTFIIAGARQGDRWRTSNATLLRIIRSAYAPRYQMDGQIIGGPGWIDTDRFDVVATMNAAATGDEMRAMVVALLADRFAFASHTETRELSVFALTLARDDGRLGSQIKPAGVNCEELQAARRRGDAPPPPPYKPGEPPPPCRTMMMFGPLSRLESGGTTMSQFASTLSQSLGRPVVDRTGLAGYFALKLEFAAEPGAESPLGPDAPGGSGDAARPAADATSVFSALQDQLGLRLVSRREPMEVLVIDEARQPTED
jgi:uncharacterized protein (TIGR03435 family)